MKALAPVLDEQTRTLSRWRHFLATDGSVSGLRQFHARHRLLLLAHDADAFRALGELVERAPEAGLAVTHARYAEGLARALARRASRAQHLNVLEHAARSVLGRLSPDEQRALTSALRDYRRADVELAVPRELLRRMLRRVAPHSWAASQTYLDPRPAVTSAD